MRQFGSGATRSSEEGKYDYEGFLSPRVLERYAQYMNENRVQADGNLRASDNWQKGMGLNVFIKSMWRHFMSLWKNHRGIKDSDTIETALCALLFNVMGYLHEVLAGKESILTAREEKAASEDKVANGLSKRLKESLEANPLECKCIGSCDCGFTHEVSPTYAELVQQNEAYKKALVDTLNAPFERAPEPLLKVGGLVTVYDRHRFAGPLPGRILRFSAWDDGVEVEITDISRLPVKYDLSSSVWVSHKQVYPRSKPSGNCTGPVIENETPRPHHWGQPCGCGEDTCPMDRKEPQDETL